MKASYGILPIVQPRLIMRNNDYALRDQYSGSHLMLDDLRHTRNGLNYSLSKYLSVVTAVVE